MQDESVRVLLEFFERVMTSTLRSSENVSRDLSSLYSQVGELLHLVKNGMTNEALAVKLEAILREHEGSCGSRSAGVIQELKEQIKAPAEAAAALKRRADYLLGAAALLSGLAVPILIFAYQWHQEFKAISAALKAAGLPQ